MARPDRLTRARRSSKPAPRSIDNGHPASLVRTGSPCTSFDHVAQAIGLHSRPRFTRTPEQAPRRGCRDDIDTRSRGTRRRALRIVSAAARRAISAVHPGRHAAFAGGDGRRLICPNSDYARSRYGNPGRGSVLEESTRRADSECGRTSVRERSPGRTGRQSTSSSSPRALAFAARSRTTKSWREPRTSLLSAATVYRRLVGKTLFGLLAGTPHRSSRILRGRKTRVHHCAALSRRSPTPRADGRLRGAWKNDLNVAARARRLLLPDRERRERDDGICPAYVRRSRRNPPDRAILVRLARSSESARLE